MIRTSHGPDLPGRSGNRLPGRIAAAAAVAALLASCATTAGYTRSQTAAMQRASLVYLAEGDPTADRPQVLATYTAVEAGDSARIPRLFPGSPPQVPHDLVGLLPITIGENPCFACHLPNMAGEDDIPVPASHFERPQVMVGLRAEPAAGADSRAALSYVAGYAPQEDLIGERYNCVQCHTPLAENVAAAGSAP